MTNTKKALVTGGTKGIGLAIAKVLRANHYEVWTTGRSESALDPNRHISADFESDREVKSLLSSISNLDISVLVNNASTTKISDLEALELEQFRLIQRVNVEIPFLITQCLSKKMKTQRYGRILNISSIFAKVSKKGRSAYSASKSALEGMTRTLALEGAPYGILVNCLAPGFVDTDLVKRSLGADGAKQMSECIPLGRLATAEEMARYAYFLVSEENTYMTGQTMVVDGGYTCE